jgi:hypothetical protein
MLMIKWQNKFCTTIKPAIAGLMVVIIIGINKLSIDNNKLKAIDLIYSYPLTFIKASEKIKPIKLIDTVVIFYYDNFILYKLPAIEQFESGKKIKGTEPYFIYKKNDCKLPLFSGHSKLEFSGF